RRAGRPAFRDPALSVATRPEVTIRRHAWYPAPSRTGPLITNQAKPSSPSLTPTTPEQSPPTHGGGTDTRATDPAGFTLAAVDEEAALEPFAQPLAGQCLGVGPQLGTSQQLLRPGHLIVHGEDLPEHHSQGHQPHQVLPQGVPGVLAQFSPGPARIHPTPEQHFAPVHVAHP